MIIGGVFRHVNLLEPLKHPEADVAFIIIGPEASPLCQDPVPSASQPLCSTAAFCASGAGSIRQSVETGSPLQNDKTERISGQNIPSVAQLLEVSLDVNGLGTFTIDTAHGGVGFVMVDAASLGFRIEANEARSLTSSVLTAGLSLSSKPSRTWPSSHKLQATPG